MVNNVIRYQIAPLQRCNSSQMPRLEWQTSLKLISLSCIYPIPRVAYFNEWLLWVTKV